MAAAERDVAAGRDAAAVDLADGPLQGLQVLEFGQLLVGPDVGTLLGDFGAQVVKVERSSPRPRSTRCATGAACATTTTRCGGRASRATSAR